jgi:tetraacyldisaccharide 4'-kinase
VVNPLEKHWRRFTVVSLLLLPLSVLFAGLAWLRKTAYRTGLLPVVNATVPVVVVGNLSVGGTGKTPVVIWLAKTLVAHGFTPGVVSRGYGGAGQLSAVTAASLPQLVGDEPVLIARRTECPVWVGRDRTAALARLVDASPQVDVVISDDGLQHYRMARDVEIVVVDAQQRFGNRLLLPAGPLREPVSRLDSVDATVINGGEAADLPVREAAGHVVPDQVLSGQDRLAQVLSGQDRLAQVLSGQDRLARAFAMHLDGKEFTNLVDPAKRRSAEQFANINLHAVAGIGNPERFFSHLRNLGLSFTPHAFPDHYSFTASELEFADADAVLMTEKDAIKCSRFARENWWALPVEAHIDIALANLVIQRIGAPRGH